MKLLFIIISLVLLSCTRMLPLKGNYPEPPFTLKTADNYDKTWSRIVDAFTERNIPIKIIDKASGLIVSEPINMATTTEKKNGDLIDKAAFIAVPGRWDPATRKQIAAYPIDTYKGSITVRLKTETTSVVTVYISGVTAQSYMNGKMANGSIAEFKSTGNFEKSFFELMK